jgi:ribosomal protein S6
MQDKHEDRMTVYELGYLIASSVSEENVGAEADKVKKIINDAGASIISEDAPHRHSLAYTIRRKTVAGSYEKYDEAYFGWVKFELGSSQIESIKKAVEVIPSVIRILITTTVRENTYLGKHAPAVNFKVGEGEKTPEVAVPTVAEATPATAEEIDKSIDAMVKEA